MPPPRLLAYLTLHLEAQVGWALHTGCLLSSLCSDQNQQSSWQAVRLGEHSPHAPARTICRGVEAALSSQCRPAVQVLGIPPPSPGF
ncbi:hypothetical protein CGRA01v4_12800 [Colletotrichum graminicola]|nr:hypothetical protein CGRA01v4_12800 [Colletotrichum graminicola]